MRYDSDIYFGLYYYYQEFSHSVDTKVIADDSLTKIYLMNTQDFLGQPISDSRQTVYDLAVTGKTSLHYKKRHKYFQIMNSLCTATKKLEKGKLNCFGSCVDYWKSCYCDYAVIFQYEHKLDSYCTIISQCRTKHGKHFD